MAKVLSSYFVNARAGDKRDKTGRYAVVNLVHIMENGLGVPATEFTSEDVVNASKAIPPLSEVTCHYDQEQTERGARLVLSSVRLKAAQKVAA